jgi:hypothetical protein
MIVSDPAAIRELQLKEKAAALDAAKFSVTEAAESRNTATSTWRNMTPEEVAAEGLNPTQRYQRNDAGKIEPITGATVQQASPNRVPQIQTALTGLTNIRALADKALSVGRFAGAIENAPIIGALAGQNRADLEGALSQIEGALIQDQLRELAKINPGGVASLANSEAEARRLASSIANLDPNQSQPEFLRGVQRAEEYFQRQLQQAGGEAQPANNEPIVTAPGTTRAAAMGAVTPGEPVMTDEDMAAGRAIQEAWNATGKFEDVARVASQFGRTFGEEEAAFLKANPGKPVNINANATGTPTAAQEAVGEFVATPGGEAVAAGAVGAANAASLGMLDELAPILGLDAQRVQMAKDYLRNKAPVSSFAGEMVGALPAMAAMSSGAGMALGGTRLAGAAPMLGDVAFGAGLAGGEAPEGERALAALTGGAVAGAAGAAGRRVFGGGSGGAGGAGDGGMTPPSGPMGGMGGRASGGAAATPEDVVRVTRAQDLPVPIQLANFQKSRAFEQQQRARELAKNNEVGGPIRQLFADQQRALAANFDAFLEKTGSEVWQQAEEQGIRITAGIKKMADQSKAKYRALYKRAETSGETREPVAYDELRAYIAEQTPTTREQLAPVLRAVDEQLSKNDAAGTGQITLQQLEDVRKLINKTVQPGTPNANYGGEMKAIIDGITENAGGDVYKAARAARREHAQLFDEVGTIAQLLNTKRNSTDRVVAAEQVVDKLVSSATPAASLRKLRDLVTGEGGDPQAWKEVQGAAIERIRNAAYPASAQVDETGARAVSVAGLRRMVDRLDQQGKLDVIFDYETAKGLRTIADVAQDVFTAPPGAVNTSGTSSALLNTLDMIINFVVAGVPIPGGVVNNVLKPIAGRVRNRDMRKEVKQLIGEPTQ